MYKFKTGQNPIRTYCQSKQKLKKLFFLLRLITVAIPFAITIAVFLSVAVAIAVLTARQIDTIKNRAKSGKLQLVLQCIDITITALRSVIRTAHINQSIGHTRYQHRDGGTRGQAAFHGKAHSGQRYLHATHVIPLEHVGNYTGTIRKERTGTGYFL